MVMRRRWPALLSALSLLGVFVGSRCLIEPGDKDPETGVLKEASTVESKTRSTKLDQSGNKTPTHTDTTRHAQRRNRSPDVPGRKAGEEASTSRRRNGATPTRRIDPDLPWSWPGQCRGQAASAQRDDYLQAFDTKTIGTSEVRVAPGVSDQEIQDLADLLPLTHIFAQRSLNAEVPKPPVFLHRTAVELRENACVASTAVAYYDGSIHITGLGSKHELKRSLRHEYAHHVLSMLGVGKPVWFQEGFAMWFASDEPHAHYATWREKEIDLDKMVEPLPVETSESDANRFYSNAAIMYEFLERLCLGRDACGPGELVSALTKEDTFPFELFLWATERRADELAKHGSLRFWQAYEKTGNFTPETLQQLLARTRPK